MPSQSSLRPLTRSSSRSSRASTPSIPLASIPRELRPWGWWTEAQPVSPRSSSHRPRPTPFDPTPTQAPSSQAPPVPEPSPSPSPSPPPEPTPSPPTPPPTQVQAGSSILQASRVQNSRLYGQLPGGTQQLTSPRPLFLVLQFAFISVMPDAQHLIGFLTQALLSVGVPLRHSVWIYPRLSPYRTHVVFALSREDAADPEIAAFFVAASARLSSRGYCTYPLCEMSLQDDPQVL